MSQPAATFAVVLVLASTTAAAPARAQATGTPARPAATSSAPAVDARAEEQAIRLRSRQWLSAERDSNVPEVMNVYAADAVAVYGGKLLTGRDAIRRDTEARFAQQVKGRPDFMASWETTSVVVARAGDMAYETGTYNDTWKGSPGRERGNFVTVWQKVGGEWKVVRDITVPEPAPTRARRRAP